MYFGNSQLGSTIKTYCMKLQTIIDMFNFDFLKSYLELAFPSNFVHDFSSKNISHIIFY